MISSTPGAVFRVKVRLPAGIVIRNTLRQQQMNQGEELMRNGDDGAFFSALGNQMLVAESQPCAFGMRRHFSSLVERGTQGGIATPDRPPLWVPALS